MSRAIYSVSSLVHYLKETLDHDMRVQSILVQGEISNFTNHRSGHWYFTLKDAKARISCVMFASYACRCRILPKEGMKVIVKASLSVYETSGQVQLYVNQLQSDGLGDYYLQYEQLKQKLAAEGLFDPQHKKPLPAYPQHIVLISAKEGAAVEDMRHTLARRWPLAKVTFLPSLVQGKDAAIDLIAKLKEADALRPDVILLGRGGGSIEDLWCFNDEQLARCIFACESVVVSGVGHETDTTLVDYVSDARAATPTAAAELVTPNIMVIRRNLSIQRQRMGQSITKCLAEGKRSLRRFQDYRYLQDPLLYVKDEQLRLAMMTRELEQFPVRLTMEQHCLQEQKQRLLLSFQKQEKELHERYHHLTWRLRQGITNHKQNRRKQLAALAGLLDAYSPLKILHRGYAVVYDKGQMMKSVTRIKKGARIDICMQDGILHTEVNDKEEFTWQRNRPFNNQ